MEYFRAVFLVLIWLFSGFVVLAVPFPIRVLNSKFNLKKEKKAFAIESPLETESPTTTSPDDQEISMPKSNSRLRLFPFYSPILNPTTKPSNRLFPEPQEKSERSDKEKSEMSGFDDLEDDKDDKDEEDDREEEEDKDLSEIRGGLPTKIFTEKTVSVPNYKTDYLGNWVYNPWGVTYGQVYRDTRFFGREFVGGRPLVDRHRYFFNPKKKRTVCKRRSTGYNVPDMTRYLSHPYYHFIHKPQIILLDLRKELYKKGKPDECHVPEQIDWRTFNECMLMRHMRMEYLIPNYPLRQIAPDSDYDMEISVHNQFPLESDPLFFHEDYPHTTRKFPEVRD